MNESVLNCHNYHSTLISLSSIIGITPVELEKFVRENNIDTIYKESEERIVISNNDLLFERLKAKYDISTYFSNTCWFHCTRVPKGTSFQGGIKPLNLMRDQLVRFIDEIAVNISVDFEPQKDIYGAKYAQKLHYMDIVNGPWAFLVREVAFYPSAIDNFDFLNIPEIVSDYIEYAHPKKRNGIIEVYKKKTAPCIVKFIHAEADIKYLKRALRYLHDKMHSMKFSTDTSAIFDGEGEIIKPEMFSGPIDWNPMQ